MEWFLLSSSLPVSWLFFLPKVVGFCMQRGATWKRCSIYWCMYEVSWFMHCNRYHICLFVKRTQYMNKSTFLNIFSFLCNFCSAYCFSNNIPLYEDIPWELNWATCLWTVIVSEIIYNSRSRSGNLEISWAVINFICLKSFWNLKGLGRVWLNKLPLLREVVLPPSHINWYTLTWPKFYELNFLFNCW